MEILSYKLLNEAAFDVGNAKSGLLSAKLITKGSGGQTYSKNFFKYLVKISFEFIDNQQQVDSEYQQILFAATFSQNNEVVFLYPFYHRSIAALNDVNGLKWGNLSLQSGQNKIDIKNYFETFKPKGQSDEFGFTLKVGDINTFNNANKQYRFSNINSLSKYISNNINGNFKMRIDSVIMNPIGDYYGDNQGSAGQSASNLYTLTLTFNPRLPQIGNLNPNIIQGQTYIVNFNNAQNPLRNIPVFSGTNAQARYITSIQILNARAAYMYIYTQSPINNASSTPIDCFVHIVGNRQSPFKTKLTLSSLQQV